MKQKIAIQAVILTLTDGRKLTYFGRAQIYPADNDKNVNVATVEFSNPKEMDLEENEHVAFEELSTR